MYQLVRDCAPLDLNSEYCYMLLCSHFAATCITAEQGGRLVGFISAYRRPTDDAVLFVWQVAVHPSVRGQGLASRMLDELLARETCRTILWVEATINPSNTASWALFESLAERRRAMTARRPFLSREHFADDTHEEEVLMRIGPLVPTS